MKAIDILRDNMELIKLMGEYNLTPSDLSLVPLIEEYESMKARGFKITFTVEYLASKHHIGVASLYRAIKRLNRNMAL